MGHFFETVADEPIPLPSLNVGRTIKSGRQTGAVFGHSFT